MISVKNNKEIGYDGFIIKDWDQVLGIPEDHNGHPNDKKKDKTDGSDNDLMDKKGSLMAPF